MSWFRDVDRWLSDEVLPYQHAYVALARRLTGNSEIAKDIVHDVYAEILAGESWRTANDPKAWVLRIVYCRAVNWSKRQKIVPIHQLPEYESINFSDFGPDAFARLSGREELELVMDILNELPSRCRQVITLRRIEELPPQEISRRLGIDLATIRGHLARGMSILTRRLAERGGELPARSAKVDSVPASKAE